MKCPAAIADGAGRFEIDDIDVGSPLADEVLVEIKAAGICHTDHASLSWQRPLVMGHEGAGVVREVGEGLMHVRPGDRVVLNWSIPCGECYQCERGNTVLCEFSQPAHVLQRSLGHAHPQGTTWHGEPIDRSFNIGTLSSLALVRKEAVTPLPAAVPFPSACIVGCGVMTGFGSAVNIARVQKGESIVVLGCGAVGLNAIQGARLAGAAKIIGVDLHSAALERAKEFGATHVIEASPEDTELREVMQRVRQLTEGRGADYAIEATCVPSLAFTPLLMIRDGGMALQVSGFTDPVIVDMSWFMWNKRYMTPLYGGCVPSRDFQRVFDHYVRGELRLDELVSQTYPLENLAEAMDDMLSGRNPKGVIVFP